ncbi:unnamed protein product, partial [Discosporangium mesarthrocarpum]
MTAGWVARSRQRCWPATESANTRTPGMPVAPAVPEKIQAESFNAAELEKCLETNSRAMVELARLHELAARVRAGAHAKDVGKADSAKWKGKRGVEEGEKEAKNIGGPSASAEGGKEAGGGVEVVETKADGGKGMVREAGTAEDK